MGSSLAIHLRMFCPTMLLSTTWVKRVHETFMS